MIGTRSYLKKPRASGDKAAALSEIVLEGYH